MGALGGARSAAFKQQLSARLAGRTVVGAALDQIPMERINVGLDRMARMAGFRDVGGWRRRGLELAGRMLDEAIGSAYRGLTALPQGEFPAFLEDLDCGRGELNPGMRQWLSESAFALVSAIAAIDTADKGTADDAEIFRMLGSIDAGHDEVILPAATDMPQIKPLAKLSIGAPGSLPPQQIIEAERRLVGATAAGALRGLHAYIPGPGTMETRALLARRYSEQFGIDIRPEQLMLLASCKSAQFTFLGTVLRRGDEVCGMTPEFPMHRSVPEMLGCRYVAWEPRINKGVFDYNLADLMETLARRPRCKVLILSYPGNPAPFMFNEQQLHDIVELCHRRGIRIFVDAPYHEIMYPGQSYPNIFKAHPKAREVCVMALSESKRLAMPGLRVGFLIGPEGIIRAVTRKAINYWSCPSSFNDRLMHEAYGEDYAAIEAWVKAEAEAYARKAAHACDVLRTLEGAFEVEPPKGGFYVYPFATDAFLNCAGMQRLAEMGLLGIKGLAVYLLLVYKTATIPGTSFADPNSFVGSHGIRLSIAGRETEDVEVGVARFAQCVRDLQAGRVYQVPDKYAGLVKQLLASL
jgi:aspartate aminotransferase